ncbi:hypothetical protein LI328DRAFT_166571 [Trichoderma asperelloides]|nr:hypothetical protein LI328DRAFT_166571 [Trichoderma asperelloides]
MLPEWATHPARGTMAIMLLFGAAFTIGHHFFYQSLSGKPPSNAVYFNGFSGGLTGQQVNLAAGSVFAFLVNSALGVVINTAANQALWVAIKTKASKLEVIDNLATATTSIWSMFDFRLWKKSPIRMALATIFWLLSVTSFITPATLNVKWSATTSMSTTRVPQIDFTSLNFANLQGQISASPWYKYSAPQYSVLQAVAGSTAGGRILPISSPHQNATWFLKFPGPALSCESLEEGSVLHDNITNNILTTMSAGVNGKMGSGCSQSFGYISWVPTTDMNLHNSFLPFPGMTLNTSQTPYKSPSQSVGPLDGGTEPLTLLVAALPGMVQGLTSYACLSYTPKNDSVSFTKEAYNYIANMTITKCTMYNTSYEANFTYVNNIQSINLTTQGSFNNVTSQTGVAGEYPLQSHESDGTFVDNLALVKNLAYQAVMDAFGRMFVGAITYDLSLQRQIIDTQMASTQLLGTKDFNFIQPLSRDREGSAAGTLEGAVDQGYAPWKGFSVDQAPNSSIPVASMMEELFRNATVSLMSNIFLQPNYSSPYAPSDVTVTVTAYSLIYSYAARTLWLAYGIALGMALLSIVLGIISIHHNGGSSYTTKFSTILRAAYCMALSEPILPEDTDGKDPTPKYIKKLTVSFSPGFGTTVRYNKAAQSSEEEKLQQIEESQTEMKSWSDDRREAP